MKDKVALVVLNWNGERLLNQLLKNWIDCSGEASIYLVDNASTDQSLNYVQQNFPSVKIIAHDQNYGFCEGYNRALRQIDAKYYVLLNSDVELSPQWLSPILDLLENDACIAACQPKILDYKRRDTFEYAGAAGGMLDRYGYPFCRGRVFEKIEPDIGQYNENCSVAWASGACMMIRADLFQKVGGFDPDFFAHMEEIDLCWRLLNKGYQIYYCAKSHVYHMGGSTLHKSNPHKTFLNFRNNLWMLHKNLPQASLFYTIFLRLVLDGISAMKFLISSKDGWQHLVAILKAHFTYYAGLKNIHQKRLSQYPQGIRSLPAVISKQSIVWQHFIKRN
jgi:hypothetical protein